MSSNEQCITLDEFFSRILKQKKQVMGQYVMIHRKLMSDFMNASVVEREILGKVGAHERGRWKLDGVRFLGNYQFSAVVYNEYGEEYLALFDDMRLKELHEPDRYRTLSDHYDLSKVSAVFRSVGDSLGVKGAKNAKFIKSSQQLNFQYAEVKEQSILFHLGVMEGVNRMGEVVVSGDLKTGVVKAL